MAENTNPAPVTLTVKVSEEGLVEFSKTYKQNMLYVIDKNGNEISFEIEDDCYNLDLKEIPEIWEPIQGARYQSYTISIIGRNEDTDDWSDPATASFNYNKKVGKKKNKAAPAATPPIIPTVPGTATKPEEKKVPRQFGRLVEPSVAPAAERKFSPTWLVIGGLMVILIAIILVGVYRAGMSAAPQEQNVDIQGDPTQEPVSPIPPTVSQPTTEPVVTNSSIVDGRNVRIEFRDNKGPITFVGTSTPSLTGSDELVWDYVDEIYLGSKQPGSKKMEIEKTIPKGKKVRFLSPYGWGCKLTTHLSLSSFRTHINTEGDRSKPKKWVELSPDLENKDLVAESYLINAITDDVKIVFVLTPY